MTEKTLTKAIGELGAIEYLRQCGALGRGALPDETRAKAQAIFAAATEQLLSPATLAPDERLLAGFLRDALAGEDALRRNPVPRYVPYTNMPLLDHFLLSDEPVQASAIWSRAKRALALLIRDWASLERSRLSDHEIGKLDSDILGFQDPAQANPIRHLNERERTLQHLVEFTTVSDVPGTSIVRNELSRYQSDWQYFAASPDRQISHFLCLPQSRWHDEFMFLYMILATECCYAGILASLRTLPPIVRRSQWDVARDALKEALFFSDFLIRVWAIFDTMPVAHFFDGFRVATGNASAIQSIRFQTLDVLTRGLDTAKQGALKHQIEVSRFAAWAPPNEAVLKNMLDLAKGGGAPGSEFGDVAKMLDRDLLQWRSRHYGIARKYLPPDTRGTGSEGIPYLAATFRTPQGATKGEPVSVETGGLIDGPGNGPARATSTFRVRRQGSPPVALIEAHEISMDRVAAFASASLPLLPQVMAERAAEISENLEGYRKFFQPFPYPVERQIGKFRKDGAFPKSAVSGLLLLSLEMRSGILMGLHDATRINGTLQFDTAADESFTGMSGRIVRCGRDELVIRDDKNIVASIREGPDKRTAVHAQAAAIQKRWFLLVMGYPGMTVARLERGISDAVAAFAEVGAKNVVTWPLHDG